MRSYLISGQATGQFSFLVDAESEEEAREKANELIEQDDFNPDLDSCDAADIYGVHPIKRKAQ